MLGSTPLNIERLPQEFLSNDRRVITRFFDPGGENRIESVVQRVIRLSEAEVDHTLSQILQRYNPRHRDIGNVFERHFRLLAGKHVFPAPLDQARQLLIGAYFTMEYSIESAALFNPSIVPAPHQDGISPGSLRLLLSLRATGEGHVSSLVFRTGIISRTGALTFDPPSPFTHRIERLEDQSFAKAWLQQTLLAMDALSEATRVIIDQLNDPFTLDEAEQICREAEQSRVFENEAKTILWVCHSNYILQVPENTDPSEIVIFPTSENEIHGIEDARFVRFVDDDQSVRYYGTFTAYDGRQIRSQLMEFQDFTTIRVNTLQGFYARHKGMALFPRRIHGEYAMLARCDGENNYLLTSPEITCWNNATLIQTPKYTWEFIQIGNCGSPLETDQGWLILTHGVGPMREYCIGAALLDLDNPKILIGQLDQPLIVPNEDEREGYVPNVVYSCGSLIHQGRLIIPYATADRATTFASVALDELLAHLQPAKGKGSTGR